MADLKSLSDHSFSRRNVFIQYLNPEILSLYGVRRGYSQKEFLQASLLMTRYALLVTEGVLILPASYLFEVDIINPFLRALEDLRHQRILGFASPTPDLHEYTPRKRREYRGELTLFDSYNSEDDRSLFQAKDLLWTPRIKRSSSRDIASEWRRELSPGGMWDTVLSRIGTLPRGVENAIEVAPERLEGRAFIYRFVAPLLSVQLDPTSRTDIAMLLSRAYLQSYITELDAVVLVGTPLGALDCGIASHDEQGRRQTVPWSLLAAWFDALGIRSLIEHRISLPALTTFRSEPGMRHLIALVGMEADGKLSDQHRARLATLVRRRCEEGSHRRRPISRARDTMAYLADLVAASMDEDEVGGAFEILLPSGFLPKPRRRTKLLQPDLGGEIGIPPVKAFISWAHSDTTWSLERAQEWTATVYAFTTILRANGIEVDVDLHHLHDPHVDWTRFGPAMIQSVDYVLIATSNPYRDRWEGNNAPTEGAGAAREADALKGMFDEDQEDFQRRVKAVILPGQSVDSLPLELRRLQRFRIDSITQPEALEDLIRTLTGSPKFPPQPVGTIPDFAPAPQESPRERTERMKQLEIELATVVAALSQLPTPEMEEGPHLPWYRAWEQLQQRQKLLETRIAEIGGGRPSHQPDTPKTPKTGP